ncbi:LysE family translocator [Gluconobacter wancherniae]|uniref:LysE family translocator n=1 Tax=Gluconobacter wancherniae TaxID=1307955 RepID=UPI0020116F5B|nr:LysE family translocator [Gluconobacter wancherniae]
MIADNLPVQTPQWKIHAMSPSWQAFAPLVVFAFVASVTPGPNNTMLAASGLNHGMRKTVPHILGVSIGFSVMIGIIGLGLGKLFEAVPQLYTILKYASALYLLWLAWKIATSKSGSENSATSRPITFLQATGFQWVNPKAWVIAIGIVSAYMPQGNYLLNLLIVCLICCIVNLPSVSLWAGFGAVMKRWLRQPAILRSFNYGMAVLLVASLYPLMLENAHH